MKRLFFTLACLVALLGGAAAARAARAPLQPALQAKRANLVDKALGSSPERRRIATIPSPHVEPGEDAFGQAFEGGKVITGATSRRMILFTFDDGPNRHTTPRLLAHLDAARVKGVFFFTASRMLGENRRQRIQQSIARDIVERGHMVGSHTFHHDSLLSLDDAETRFEVLEAERMFLNVLGQRPYLFRPPGGNHSLRTDTLIEGRGYTTLLWNLGTGDTQVSTPEEVFNTWRRVFERREEERGERGGVILLHDIHAWAVDAFPLIHAELMRRNCELLVQGEELFDIVSDPSFFFQARDPARVGEVASPAEPDAGVWLLRQARIRAETQARCADNER